MDGRCVFLFLSVFVINFSFVTIDGKQILIRDSFRVKPFDNRLGTKQLNTVVVDALTAKYKNRKMLEVSKSRYNFHMAWRGIREFFWKKVLNVFCPSINRELKVLNVYKEMLNNESIRKKLGFVLPAKKIKIQKKGETSEEKSEEESDEESEEKSDEESDEESDEKSDEESDEESDEDKKRNQKKGKNSKNNKDIDSDKEDKKKKKNTKTLDDLFK